MKTIPHVPGLWTLSAIAREAGLEPGEVRFLVIDRGIKTYLDGRTNKRYMDEHGARIIRDAAPTFKHNRMRYERPDMHPAFRGPTDEQP